MNIGDIKKKRKFAWFPTMLETKQLIWLTHYIEHSIYNTKKESGILDNHLLVNKIWTEEITKWRVYRKLNQYDKIE